MHHPEHLPQILILLLSAVVVVAVFRAMRLSPVLGYLVAGALIGPYGFKMLEDTKVTSSFAEFGVIFLLFSIGMEVSFDRLRAMRKQVFGFGTAQVLLTAIILGLAAKLLGLPTEAAIIIAGGLALSSTAVVLQVVAESGEKSSQIGRLSLSVLLLQDLIVVPMLVLVPLLADDTSSILSSVTIALFKAAGVLIAIIVVGRLLIRPLFRLIASLNHADIFVATTLLVVLGISWITGHFGLSLALGAFIGGLLVAETEYQHQVEADILPYKGLFLGLFFISVGMMIDIRFIISNLSTIAGLAVGLMLIKALIIAGLCRLFGFSTGAAIHSGLLLSQGGEFAFILFTLASENTLLTSEQANMLLVVVTVTMALTPLMAAIGKRIRASIRQHHSAAAPELPKELHDLQDHVVIAGYGRMGQLVGKLLQAENIPFVAVDYNSAEVANARSRGEPVYFGDAGNKKILMAVGAGRARAVFLTLKGGDRIEKMVRLLRGRLPSTPLVVRARDARQAASLLQAGATEAIPELLEGSLSLGAAVLKSISVPDHEIDRIINAFRSQGYAICQQGDASPGWVKLGPQPEA